MDYNNLFNNYGYLLYDKPYCQFIFMALFIQLLTTTTGIKFSYLTFLNITGYYLIGFLKNYFKTNRPDDCNNNSYDICPDSYDIPSGHSFYAIFWAMLIYNSLDNIYYKNIKKGLIIYLAFIPVSRYLSGVHTLTAVIFGSLIGFIWFIFSKIILD